MVSSRRLAPFQGLVWQPDSIETGATAVTNLQLQTGHPLISRSDSKNDPADARTLARLARIGPELLSPIRVRSEKTQVDLALVKARDVAV
jgi:hypothetical protein